MNSYQKLKQKHTEEIQRLTNDIKALVSDPNGMPYKIAREKWRFILKSQDSTWQGSHTESGNGFLDLISGK